MLHGAPVSPSPPAPARRDGAFLAAILALLVPVQVLLTAGTADMNVDGGYYLDVAMHLRDGLGLVSDVSLYHAGFPSFPHPTPIYPLWPWLLGLAGRLVEITWAAHWLPFACWVLSLVGAWAFGRRLSPEPLLGVVGLHGGHLLALLLGLQREYSRFAAQPYTEALAYALLFGFLWRLAAMEGRLRDGLELGIWLSLICLTRSQLFVAPVAVAMALGLLLLVGGERGRRWLGPGAVAFGVVGLSLAAWWLHSRSFLPEASPLVLLRFDQAQVSDVLAPIDVIAPTDGPVDFVLDRLGGLAVAYGSAGWTSSYARGFFLLHWALPLGLLLALPLVLRLRRAEVLAWLRGPRALPWLVLGLLALGGLASVHLPHKQGFGTWYFHRRHAIISILAFYPCLLLLLRHPGAWARRLGLGFLVVQVGLAAESLGWRINDLHEEGNSEAGLDEVAAWLQARASAEEPLVVAINAFYPPQLAWRTEHVGYHWYYERTRHEDLEAMFDELGTDLLLFDERQTRRWYFRLDSRRFARGWREHVEAPPGFRAFRRVEAPEPGESQGRGP